MEKNKTIKAIIVVPALPLDTDKIQGGVHSAVINLLRGFALISGVHIRCVTFTREVRKEQLVKLNDWVEICYVPEGPFPLSSINYLFFCGFRLRRQIEQFSADIVHFQIAGSLLTTKLLGLKGRPQVLTIHGIPTEELKLKTSVKDKINARFNLAVGNALMPGNIIHIAEFSRQYYHGQWIKRSITIPNAISDRYFRIPMKEEMTNRLLYIGIINERKNLLSLLEALVTLRKQGKSYSLDVCGGFANPEYQAKVEQYMLANQLDGLVRFRGWVSQKEVLQLLQASDALVLTSKAETLPMAIAEAMAAGRFAIASAVGGIPDMIDNQVNGCLIDIKKPDELVKILADLHNNSSKTCIIAGKARETALKNYDSAIVAAETRKFYQLILEKEGIS